MRQPAGASAAASALPCAAPAVGRLSTTMGGASRPPEPWAMRHATRPAEPPGAKGMTKWVGSAGRAIAEDAAAAGILRPAPPATAFVAAITVERRAMAVRATIATGASTAAQRDKPPDISLPVFGSPGRMARAIEA
jgi:hypothetical protein